MDGSRSELRLVVEEALVLLERLSTSDSIDIRVSCYCGGKLDKAREKLLEGVTAAQEV